MYEYIYFGLLAAGLIVAYCFINSPGIAGILFKRVPSSGSKKRGMSYLEHFREHREGKEQENIIVQSLPWLLVLVLFFILSNQFFIFALVSSGSMEPIFQKGDLVLMQTLDKKVKVGDIVMFGMYGMKEPITHRAIHINERGYITTKGDANPTTDGSPIPPERVYGKVILIGGKPIVIKGMGYGIRPENIGEFKTLTKLPRNYVIAQAFQKFQAIQPFIILFGTIFYFFILMEGRMEKKRRLSRNGIKSMQLKVK